MKNLKIGQKLAIVFAIIIAGIAFVASYGINTIGSMTMHSQAMKDNNMVGVGMVTEISNILSEQRVDVLKLVYEDGTSAAGEQLAQSINETDSKLQEMFGAIQNTDVAEEYQGNLDSLKQSYEAYKTELNKVVQLLESGSDQAAVISQAAAADDAAAGITEALGAINEYNQSQADTMINSDQNNQWFSMLLMLGISAGTVTVAILLAIGVTRGITKPIGKIVDAADRLAQGDTGLELDIHKKDETGMLARAFQKMTDSIKLLTADADMLSKAAAEERFGVRADAGKHMGDYRKIIEGVNATMDTIVEKMFWYETMLDSIPFPVSVTDKDNKIRFINKKAEEMFRLKRKEALGNDYKGWKADAEYLVKNGLSPELARELSAREFQADASEIRNLHGESTGKIEVLQDVTAKSHAENYSRREVKKLSANLRLLKEGNLHLDFSVEEGDAFTRQEHDNFQEINRNFEEAVCAIEGYIRELTHILGNFAEGDLTENITSGFKGDFAALKDSTNRIVTEINRIFKDFNLAADQVTIGASQVSDGNQMISQGAAEQASAIEELSAAMSQLAEKTGLNAENSKQSNAMAMEAKNAAQLGNERMRDMMESMKGINQSSENISKIIKVIDDIAFQTNILALNAAVEAARAGLHGKGFAVVAEEVRNLAARSADAARETTELIEDSIQKVGAGTKIAQETALALGKIVETTEETVRLGEMIAAASGEQASGIMQVNQGIEQLSGVVQTNSATAQEGAAASEELSGQAELLKEKISRFKLKSSGGGTDPAQGSLPHKDSLEEGGMMRPFNMQSEKY
jgi:methyl-accepting chemotaxis protein